MRNTGTWLIAMTLLCFGGNGCSRSGDSKDLSTLNQAYEAGVLNKQEYEAKKTALESRATAIKALDDALANHAITQADYQQMKARLISKSSTLGSLERASQAGALTQEEYLAKKSALLGDENAATPSGADVGTAHRTSATSSTGISLAAQSGMKTINPSAGGKIIYGQVAGQTTEAGAMGAVLRSLHNQLGNRPQVGKLFQVRGTQSVAAFFSVNKTNQGGGQISGLIIAAKTTSDHVEAALVSDDAARFPKTLSPMMKTLFSAWHPFAGAQNAGSGSPSGAPSGPAPLRQITLPDRSASVGLPDGWNVVANRSSMGTIVASGPNGEVAELDTTFLAYDTNNRSVQQTMQMLRNGRLANSAYAKATYYPYGGDLAKTFVYMIENMRRKAGLPQPTFNFTTVAPMAGSGRERCIRMSGTADMGNGKGSWELNGVYCASPPGRFGGWLSEAYTIMAPVRVAAAERATLGAILQSFNVNMSVVNAQSARISAPAIAQIHEVGRAAANQAAAAHERNDIQNSSVYQHWDNNDKRSQEFENYQLGYSVISDTGNNVHGTLWNEDAAALVQSNPDKYEYVSAPNYWKGVDY